MAVSIQVANPAQLQLAHGCITPSVQNCSASLLQAWQMLMTLGSRAAHVLICCISSSLTADLARPCCGRFAADANLCFPSLSLSSLTSADGKADTLSTSGPAYSTSILPEDLLHICGQSEFEGLLYTSHLQLQPWTLSPASSEISSAA